MDADDAGTGVTLHGGNADRFGEALRTVGYTVDGVGALLGPAAAAALQRGEHVPGLRATTGGAPLETLVRLFLLGAAEPAAACAAALAPLSLSAALAGGLLAPADSRLRAALDVRPYAEAAGPASWPDSPRGDEPGWWVVSDLGTEVRPGPLAPDHVLGVGGASLTLAQATLRRPVGSALDLGTGCGVQALHLSRHAGAVTATDVSPRALALAALTARLSGVGLELLGGDLLEPVAGRRFDLVVSNPPFVVGPGGGSPSYAYRDSGLAGDAVSERLVRGLPAVLADGGVAQLLVNWEHRAGADWRERVAGWVAGSGCDAWLLQREVQDPAEYAALWLRDAGQTAGPGYADAYGRWLDWFAAAGVEAVGFGVVTLRSTGASDPTVRVEDVRQAVAQPLWPSVAGWLDRIAWLRGADLAAARLVAAPDLRLEQVAVRAGGGWELALQVLRQEDGLRRRADVDALVADLTGGCDGTVALGTQLELLAQAHGLDPAELRAAALPAVATLVEEGYLLPAALADPARSDGSTSAAIWT